ncbi:MAG: metallophosphatase domain-containing protein [Flavobacteriales bacterium]|jgi:Icc-related predicted phosphoesterase|nr:metallophosphatase domain-containing protein [Flavobacteriales bacterium]
MKIVFISDTHGKHHEVRLPKGDLLIHTGDISSLGEEEEVLDFIDWFSEQPFKYKIFIAGNHDGYFERNDQNFIKNKIPFNVIYLNDSGTEIEGIKIWGSPITPAFFNWYFNRERGLKIQHHWDLIPNDVDILLTHGPPYSILDMTHDKRHVGCENLLDTIVQRVKPRIHAFGHIHESCGEIIKHGIHFLNASVLNQKYRLVNKPIVTEFDFLKKITKK